MQDPDLAREAIAFYQVASYVFRSGLYRNQAPQPPDRHAGADVAGGGGS